jgi:hypothetical protein
MSGKGSSPRPFSVSQQEYDTRWDAIFCRDLKNEEDQKLEDEAFEQLAKQKEIKSSEEGAK